MNLQRERMNNVPLNELALSNEHSVCLLEINIAIKSIKLYKYLFFSSRKIDRYAVYILF